MRLTYRDGSTPLHVSLLRGDRHLLAGCDVRRLWALILVCFLAPLVMHFVWYIDVACVVGLVVGIAILRFTGRKSPWFWPVYGMALRTQRAYLRSSAPWVQPQPYPDMQES